MDTDDYLHITVIIAYDNKAIHSHPCVQETTYPSKWRWIPDTLRCCQSAACWEPSTVGSTPETWQHLKVCFQAVQGHDKYI